MSDTTNSIEMTDKDKKNINDIKISVDGNVSVSTNSNTTVPNANANVNTDTNNNANGATSVNGENNNNDDVNKTNVNSNIVVNTNDNTPAYKPAYEILTKQEKKLVFCAVCMGMFLSSLDSLVVSVSLPVIIKKLGGQQYLSWVISAYLLTSSSTMPLYGKFSDIYGRRIVYQFALFFFFAGSFTCGFAVSIYMLILGRAIQGIGGGGLMSLSMVIIGDIAKPAVRTKYISSLTGILGMATALGPLIGGGFTQYVSWRWIFFVNNPFIFVTMIVSWRLLGKVKNAQKTLKVDVLGSVFIVCATTCLVLVVTWGGTTYEWSSYIITILIVASALTYGLFIYQETIHPQPIIRFEMFRIRNYTVSFIVMFLYGMAILGAFGFLPFFFEYVCGDSPIISGFKLIPMIFGLMMCSTFTGIFISRTGKFILFPKLGMALFSIGMGLCMLMGQHTNYGLITLYLFVTGTGMGFGSPVYNSIVQNSVPPQHMATSVASLSFVRQLGGCIGISVSGTLFDRYTNIYSKIYSDHREAQSRALHHVFLSSVCCGLIAFVITFAIKNVQIFVRKPKGSQSAVASNNSDITGKDANNPNKNDENVNKNVDAPKQVDQTTQNVENVENVENNIDPATI